MLVSNLVLHRPQLAAAACDGAVVPVIVAVAVVGAARVARERARGERGGECDGSVVPEQRTAISRSGIRSEGAAREGSGAGNVHRAAIGGGVCSALHRAGGPGGAIDERLKVNSFPFFSFRSRARTNGTLSETEAECS